MLAAGHEPTKKYATAALDTVSALAKTKVGLDAMHSTIGRHAARAVSCAVQVDMLADQWTALVNNIGKADVVTFNKNYQCVVPSTWNACPRNDKDEPGPYEASIADNPIADPERPLEVLRTVHSFDPCIACAIHVTDTENGNAITVKAK